MNWEDHFVLNFGAMQQAVHRTAVDNGWYESERNRGELIALIHSELSEALEALRAGNGPDPKLPEFSGLEVELADAVIRIMDSAVTWNCRLAEAIVAKNAYNRTRGHRHGGKLF